MTNSDVFLNGLKTLFPPPDAPVDATPNGQLAEIEEELGIQFPPDLIEFVSIYGSGVIENKAQSLSIEVRNPLARNYRRFLCASQSVLKYFNSPYKTFPDRPGLLTWGKGDGRRQFCWLVDGEPSEWKVVIISADQGFLHYETTMTGFIYGLLSGKIDDYGSQMTGDWFREQKTQYEFDPDRPYDASKMPPLWDAVMWLDYKKVIRLLEAGEDPNTEYNGNSLLFPVLDAVRNEQILESLLEAGTAPNFKTEEGRTPLMMAANADDGVRCVDLLLVAGADVSTTDEEGWTALHYSSSRKVERSVQLLLNAGANPTAETDDGKTPIQLARKNEAICQMLRAAGAKDED